MKFLTHVAGRALCFGAILLALGCVRRSIVITSDPSGALVWLNHQEVGRTPLEVDFLYYGDYDVRLVLPDFEPMATHAAARPPWWDMVPLDLIAEAVPGEPHARIAWHFVLEPRRDEPEDVLWRAGELRSRVEPGDGPSDLAGPPPGPDG